ncbi:hypothetical protein [Paenibacillus agilis]|nr:hypothetical protein [Paenibacillus agilis]
MNMPTHIVAVGGIVKNDEGQVLRNKRASKSDTGLCMQANRLQLSLWVV